MSWALIDCRCKVCDISFGQYITDGMTIICPSGHECGVWRDRPPLESTHDGRIFGKGVRSARRDKKMTLAIAADKCGMRIVRLSEIEQGIPATADERQKIRDALGLA